MNREDLVRLRAITASERVDGGADLSAEELQLVAAVLDEFDTNPAKQLWDLLVAVREQYPDDPSAPGIHVSCIGPREFYASVQRFHERMGKGKEIVVGLTGQSFVQLIRQLDAAWKEKLDFGRRFTRRSGQ